MRRPPPGNRLFCSLTLAACLPALSAGCASSVTRPGMAQPSFTEKVSGGVKSGTAKIASWVSPKPAPGSDPAPQPSSKPGPGVFVMLAEMHERSGNVEEAETQLRKALAIDANHFGTLVAYGHLEDRRGNFEAATKYYQKALKKHPKEAAAHNDLGVCFHRRGLLPEAAKSLQTAVELQPHRKLYRDNLAAVLVDQAKPTEALVQLCAAHGEAVGNYNLGYLLVQKKDKPAALYHFRKAVEKDPSLIPANEWIAQLSGGAAPAGALAAQGPPVMVAQRPALPDANGQSGAPRREASLMPYPTISPSVVPSFAAPQQVPGERRLPAVEPARG